MVNSVNTKIFFFDLILSLKFTYLLIYFLLVYLSLSFSEETLLLIIFVTVISVIFYFFNAIIKRDLFFSMSNLYNFFLSILQQKLFLDNLFEINCLNLNNLFNKVNYLNKITFYNKKSMTVLPIFFAAFSLNTFVYLFGAFSVSYTSAVTCFFYLLTSHVESIKKNTFFLKKTKKMATKLNFISSKIEILRSFTHLITRKRYLFLASFYMLWLFAEYGRYSIPRWRPWYNCFNSVLLLMIGKTILPLLTNRWNNVVYKTMAPYVDILEIEVLL